MMPPAPAPVAEGSGSRSSRAATLSEMQHTKKPAPASLKRVEQLLLEGERLPFELTKVRYYCCPSSLARRLDW